MGWARQVQAPPDHDSAAAHVQAHLRKGEIKTWPKLNPLSFSAAAVACAQESHVSKNSWHSAVVHEHLLGIITPTSLLPSLTPADKNIRPLPIMQLTSPWPHLLQPFVTQRRVPGPFRRLSPAHVYLVHALAMPHDNKVLPLSSQRGPSLLLLDCCLGLCLQLLRKAPAQQGFYRSGEVGGSTPLLLVCNLRGPFVATVRNELLFCIQLGQVAPLQ